MGKSKRKKAASNAFTLFPSVAGQQQLLSGPVSAESPFSTPGRGLAVSPRPQRESTGDAGSFHHLPTITRGPEALRQMRNPGSCPVQRTPANQAAASKIQHLRQIATWAATNKIPTLGAFYGERLASACQSAGIPSPVLNSQCERCESILLPGVNCTVRVAPKKRKKKACRKGTGIESLGTLDTVMHRCHYCKYGNREPGGSKDHVKTKLAEAAARAQMKDAANSSRSAPTVDPITPVHTPGLPKTLAEGALSVSVTPVGSPQLAALTPTSALEVDQSVGSSLGFSRKRKRKGWTGLRVMSASLQRRELPTPERLGFEVDFNSPLNPRKKGTT